MALKTLACRAHGGTFQIEPRRGRPPVRCTTDNPCSGPQASPQQIKRAADKAATVPRKISRPELVASEIKNRRVPNYKREPTDNIRSYADVAAGKAPRQAESDAKPRTGTNPSLPMAQVAKAKLEVLGWTVNGRAWADDLMEDPNPAYMAQVTGARGEETISLTWQDGVLVDQTYSLWSEKPSDNGKPPGKLDFNPSEMTDAELIRAISGMKVTWWNSLARSNESAIVGKKLTIEHIYDTAENGTEAVKRLVKFVDLKGSSFRAFHVDALLKVS